MGIIDNIRTGFGTYYRAVASPLAPYPNHLERIVWSGLTGETYNGPVTRGDAMRVPAIVRGRGLIVTTIARSPLTAERDGELLDDQPRWITRTTGPISAFHRMLWTADDLLFYGWSLWRVTRDYDGIVIDATRVPIEAWQFADNGDVRIDDETVDARDVILIPGIHEGILEFGGDTIRQARGLLATAERAATNPTAMVELHQTNEYPMTDEEIDRLIKRWSAARRGENGGVSFTSSGIEAKEHGAALEHLVIEGRTASSIDCARILGIPASMIDANSPGSSLSYSNTASRMNELISFGIAPIMAAITARLSLDDVTPRGTTIRFDTSDIVAAIIDENDVARAGDGQPQLASDTTQTTEDKDG